ncbi:MAG: hypothetical protein IJO79_02660 [Firmicutes bacterium]|nr:hypothetical protein [Bacillota bacterium]
MFGYITPLRPELKLKEYDRYSAYYCAVCQSLGRRYGPLPRLTLSYDSVFMAMLADGLNEAEQPIEDFRCLIHPSKKRGTFAPENPGVDWAADLLFLMAYYKMKDDVSDEKKAAAAAGTLLMKGSFKKLKKLRPRECEAVARRMGEQAALEAEGCTSLDRAAEPSSLMMEDLFSLGAEAFLPEKAIPFGRIGYYMGKWIYLMDALDDLEKDHASGSYNPLLLRFAFDSAKEDMGAFRDRICEPMKDILFFCLAELSRNFAEIPLKHNKEILENIIYFGLRYKTEELLKKR